MNNANPSHRPRAPDNLHGPRGFTLIEILVVVVIIGILGAVIVPNLLSRPDQARITAAQTDLRQLANALDIYRLDNFHYPSTEQGLDALVDRPAGFPEPRNWNPDGYIKALPSDPWGSPYIYERRSSDFTLFSLGADGVEGGEGAERGCPPGRKLVSCPISFYDFRVRCARQCKAWPLPISRYWQGPQRILRARGKPLAHPG